MASGKPDPEDLSPSAACNPQDDNNNPFVRFKRFADTQAGYVLKGMQSIIGLPSSYTKSYPDGQHVRWADWDDHLKRRDEAQVKQNKDPKDLQSKTRARDDGNDSEAERTSTSHCTLSRQERAGLLVMDDEGESDGLYLYMPITKALFGQLLVDFEDRTFNSTFGPHSAHSMSNFMNFLKDDNNIIDHMPIVQAKVFDRLAHTSYPTNNMSILPYLMFSDYSPLRLTFQMPLHSIGSKAQGNNQVFPYAGAFQDLLLYSQGQDMKNLEDMALTRGSHNIWTSWSNEPGTQERTGNAISWLGEMTRVGLLWTKVDPSCFEHNDTKTQTAPDRAASISPQTKESSGDAPQTEFDLYETVLNAMGGCLPTDEELTTVLSSFQKAMNKAEEEIRAVFPLPKHPNSQPREQSFTDLIIGETLGMINQFRELIDPPHSSEESRSENRAQGVEKDEEVRQLLDALKQAAGFNMAEKPESYDQPAKSPSCKIDTSSFSEQHTTREADGTTRISHVERTTNMDGSVTVFVREVRNHPDGTSSLREHDTLSVNGQVTEEDLSEFLRDGTYASSTTYHTSNPDGSITVGRKESMEYPDGSSEAKESMITKASYEKEWNEEFPRNALSRPFKQLSGVENSEEVDEDGLVLETAPHRSAILKSVAKSNDHAAEVEAWEEEGRRIRAAREVRGNETEDGRPSQPRKSPGKGWFWE